MLEWIPKATSRRISSAVGTSELPKTLLVLLAILGAGASRPLVAEQLFTDAPGAPATSRQECQLFDLGDVQLLDGPFKTAMDLNAEYLLSLDSDRLLAGIRSNAGLEPKAPRYGGWESGSVAGLSLGHYMTALAQQYRASGDRRFLDREDYIVAELAVCQTRDTSGFLAMIPSDDTLFTGLKRRHGRIDGSAPWYLMHKLLAGLRDAYRLCGNEQAKDVLIKLTRWADSVTQTLTPQEVETMLGAEHGGMAEVLADAYAISGEPEHLVLARRFCHRFVMDPLARGEDRLDGLHANTQIPKITGAARMWELTGEDYFHDVTENFWDFVVANRTYVIGGNSDNEHFFPPDRFARHLSTSTCETCNTYNMLRLSEHLFCWQPAARWMDYYERALYNQILGSQDPRTGMFTYFQSLKAGGFKFYSHPTNAFWCCVGTGMENHTKYGAAIYAHSADALWVNLFIPSELTWDDMGLTLRQETQFPETDTTRLSISAVNPVAFALKIRTPCWLTAPLSIRVNGQSARYTMKAGYASIARTWQDGDRVEVGLPMGLHTQSLPHSPHVLAVLHGPIVLAGDLGTQQLDELDLYQTDNNQNIYRDLPVPVVPYFVVEQGKLLDHLEPLSGQPLVYRTRNLTQPNDITLLPYFRMHHRRYAVYFETFTLAGWEQKKAELRAAEEARRAFEARIVDDIKTGEQQSEAEHAFRGERSFCGGSAPRWRDAREGGWFEYTVRVLPDQPMELLLTYWGSDGGNREFDIQVDGQHLATEKLNASRPIEHFEKSYAVPRPMTRGKSQVVLRFQARPGNFAGGLFGLRVMREETDRTTGNSP